METLRVLLVTNARVAVMSGGLSVLLDAIFDPLFADMVVSHVYIYIYMYIVNHITIYPYLQH